MKKHQQMLWALAFVFILYGCGNSKSPTPAEATHQHETEATDLGLNDGSKWEVNAEMMGPITAMKETLAQSTSTTLDEYNDLGSQLQSQNQELISSCTMNGPAHDELHKWLLPHLDLVDNLAKSSDLSSASSAKGDLLKSMKTFDTYFE